MAIEGSLEIYSLPEILHTVSVQRKTGILAVQGEEDIIAVSFKDGQVVAADALNQTVEEGLGQVLASQGLVSPEDFSRAQNQHEAGGKRLLDLLVAEGLLERGQLLEALRVQTYRLLLQLLRWEQGDFKFYGGDEVAYEEGFSAISIEELLVRSLGDLGGDGHVSKLPDLALVYQRVPGAAPVKVIGNDGEGPTDDPGAVWLAPEEVALIERLDGTVTGEEILREVDLGEYKVLFTLLRLLRAGVVEALVPTEEGQDALLSSPAGAPATSEASPAPDRWPGEGVAWERPRGPRPAPAVPTVRGPALEEELPQPEGPPGEGVQRPVDLTVVGAWLRAAAALAALVLLVVGIQRPWALLFPFPWQEEIQERMERNRRVALYQQIDRAARAHFLLEGHYPDALVELVHMGVLDRQSLLDPQRRPLAYTVDDASYELLPVEGGAGLSELATREAITGDFLLDPEFLGVAVAPERPPLVLLD